MKTWVLVVKYFKGSDRWVLNNNPSDWWSIFGGGGGLAKSCKQFRHEADCEWGIGTSCMVGKACNFFNKDQSKIRIDPESPLYSPYPSEWLANCFAGLPAFWENISFRYPEHVMK